MKLQDVILLFVRYIFSWLNLGSNKDPHHEKGQPLWVDGGFFTINGESKGENMWKTHGLININ